MNIRYKYTCIRILAFDIINNLKWLDPNIRYKFPLKERSPYCKIIFQKIWFLKFVASTCLFCVFLTCYLALIFYARFILHPQVRDNFRTLVEQRVLLDNRLFKWFCRERDALHIIRTFELRRHALQIARGLNYLRFKASDSWVWYFRILLEINRMCVCPLCASVIFFKSRQSQEPSSSNYSMKRHQCSVN